MRLCSMLVFSLIIVTTAFCGEKDASLQLAPHVDQVLKIVRGQTPEFTVSSTGMLFGSKEPQSFSFGRKDERSFYIKLDGGKDIKGTLVVTQKEIFIDLPAKGVAFVSEGALTDEYHRLKPRLIFDALVRLNPAVEKLWPLVEESDGRAVAVAFQPFINAETVTDKDGKVSPSVRFRPRDSSVVLQVKLDDVDRASTLEGSQYTVIHAGSADIEDIKKATQIQTQFWTTCSLPTLPEGRKIIKVSRDEMEKSLTRGILRAIDLKVDDLNASELGDEVVEIPGARLEIKDGQRTAWLTGSPREMGVQHGKLLKQEVRRVTDSTLYVVGLYYSVAKGEWFLDTIRDAWRRLEPHTDKEYIEELQGLAEGAGIAYDEMKLANVFPELFHCSGFAVSGEATVGGKLYHGRVLDYMTEVGFQHAQCDFITQKPGKKGTANIGYAGFIGCVSGMNDAQISMGEMGGRGEGNWDGTPMAFLMRRVLENAGSLDEAKKIMSEAKRTCEYYYVIADGKTRGAVGVAAFPEKIEFINQNQAHPQLPNAFPGCVLLSIGDRYVKLSERVKDTFSKLDEKGALELMSRPVAMKGNLHNVLFVPEDQVYWVAHASAKGHEPAATQEYVKHDLKGKLEGLKTVGKK